ncbi:MAG: tetratricopeptide repeat protein [Planctomycetota bacterium]
MSADDANLRTRIIEKLRAGDFEGARGSAQSAVDSTPDNAPLWHLLGIAHVQCQELELAIPCLEKAVELKPSKANYHFNLGYTLQKLSRIQDAKQVYRKAIQLQANFVEAQTNLANLLVNEAAFSEAILIFRDVIHSNPENADACFNLANALLANSEFEESTQWYRAAIDLDCGHSAARENLARAYTERSMTQDAVGVLQSWLEFDPDNEFAKYMQAAITGEDLPDRASDECVKNTFDRFFATSFEEQLAKLDYRMPALIQEYIDSIDKSDHSIVLDAGCGTGLIGPILKPISSRLVGVDLSEDMLAEAKSKRVYDELVEAELSAFFKQRMAEFDLIVCSDTLCYFGELSEVVAASAGSLTDQGNFLFTVEAFSDPEPPESESSNGKFQLQANGRYRHWPEYVKSVVSKSGLKILDCRLVVIRKELGVDVSGLLVVCMKIDD